MTRKNFKNANVTSINNKELNALMKERYGIELDDFETGVELRLLAEKMKKAKEEKAMKKPENIKSWSKPSSATVTNAAETPDQYRKRMSQGDKGFLGGLITAAGIWLLSKAGAKPEPQPKQQPLTADEEFAIVERRLNRDAYLRYISNR